MERSDNESLRLKKDIMEDFIRTRFYELAEDTDISQAYTEFEREHEQQEVEAFATENGIEYPVVRGIMTEYIFKGAISNEAIRQSLAPYHLGLLKITKLTTKIKDFIERTYRKYRAEGV